MSNNKEIRENLVKYFKDEHNFDLDVTDLDVMQGTFEEFFEAHEREDEFYVTVFKDCARIFPMDRGGWSCMEIREHEGYNFKEEALKLCDQLNNKTTLNGSLLDKNIEACALPVRAISALRYCYPEDNRIYTLGDLVNLSEREILRYRHLGHKTLSEIVQYLDSIGLEMTK